MAAETSALLTVSQAASRLNVSVMTVKRMIYRREVRAARIGKLWRIPVAEVVRLETPVVIAAPTSAPAAIADAPVTRGATATTTGLRIFSDRPWESEARLAASRGSQATRKAASVRS